MTVSFASGPSRSAAVRPDSTGDAAPRGVIALLGRGASRLLALALPVVALGILAGCLLDIYGGAPRAQLENRTALPVRSITLGPPDSAVWSRTFSPAIAPGARSQTFDLPAAGDLRLHATFEGMDSARALEARRFEPGTFARIVVQDTAGQP